MKTHLPTLTFSNDVRLLVMCPENHLVLCKDHGLCLSLFTSARLRPGTCIPVAPVTEAAEAGGPLEMVNLRSAGQHGEMPSQKQNTRVCKAECANE